MAKFDGNSVRFFVAQCYYFLRARLCSGGYGCPWCLKKTRKETSTTLARTKIVRSSGPRILSKKRNWELLRRTGALSRKAFARTSAPTVEWESSAAKSCRGRGSFYVAYHAGSVIPFDGVFRKAA